MIGCIWSGMIWQMGVRDSNTLYAPLPKTFHPLNCLAPHFQLTPFVPPVVTGIAQLTLPTFLSTLSQILIYSWNWTIKISICHLFGNATPSFLLETSTHLNPFQPDFQSPDTDHLTNRSSLRESWKKPWCHRSSIVMKIMIILTIIVHDYQWPLMIIKRQSLNATQRRRTLAILSA